MFLIYITELEKATHGIKGEPYCHLKDYLKYGKEAGRLLPNLGEGYDLDDLNNYIDSSRDFFIQLFRIKTLYDRYLLKNNQSSTNRITTTYVYGNCYVLAQDEKK